MKICIIGPTHPFRGGISHYTTLLYRHLRKRHEVLFISFKRQYLRLLFPGKSDIDPSKKQIREDAEKLLEAEDSYRNDKKERNQLFIPVYYI